MSSAFPLSASRKDRPAGFRRGPRSKLAPVQDYFSGIAGTHYVEALLEVPVREPVRDHLADIHAAADHGSELVPGLAEHTAVDAADVQPLEHDRIPVDTGLTGLNAEHGDLAAVRHGIDHLPQARRVARHL